MITVLRKQVESAFADRERERLRNEGLHRTVRDLQRQLEREVTKARLLEKTWGTGTCKGSDRKLVQETASVPSRAPPTARRQYQEGGHASVDFDQMQASLDYQVGAATPRLHAGYQSAFGRYVGEPPLSERSCGRLPPKAKEVPSLAEVDEKPFRNEMAELCSDRSWEFVVQGQYDSTIDQEDFAPKLITCSPEDAVSNASKRGAAFLCTRGRRGGTEVPNQDDFLMARHSLGTNTHVAMYGVFDGHGPAGHHCAAQVRGCLPEILFGSSCLLTQPEVALRGAFAEVQEHLRRQTFDTQTSGTTATVALVVELPSVASVYTAVVVAHVGDSRAVLASRRADGLEVRRLSRDHRADDLEEATRVQAEGGEVRQLRPGSGAARVYAPGSERPAMALTRSLGAFAAKHCGVSGEPEVTTYKIRPGQDVLLLLGSDGLFEFCSGTDIANRVCSEGVSEAVLQDICSCARRRWARNSANDTVDDITIIAVSLPGC